LLLIFLLGGSSHRRCCNFLGPQASSKLELRCQVPLQGSALVIKQDQSLSQDCHQQQPFKQPAGAVIGRRNFALTLPGLAAAALVPPPLPAVAASSPAGEAASPWFAVFSGAVQGIAQNLVKQAILHPFDTVKTRLQTTQTGSSSIERSDLFRDLYRGFLPCIVSGTPGSATFFAAKEVATQELAARGVPAQLKTVGGVVAGVLSAKAVRTPFDVAETKAMAATGGGNQSLLDWDGSLNAVSAVLASEGITGLYRGYGANVAYKLPADAAKFLAYEALKGTGSVNALPPGVAGAVATLIANTVTTPLDVVRTRVMVEGDKRNGSSNVVAAFKDIFASGDATQLWSGLNWRIARGIIAGAIQFSVLEGTKSAVEGGRR